MAVLGPFYVAEYKPGSHVLLRRNPNYWKRDESGNALPYLDAVKLEIQTNRDIEMLKFTRNEIQLINAMDADYFDKLSHSAPGKVRDAGPWLGFRADVVQPGARRSDRGLQAGVVPLAQLPACGVGGHSVGMICAEVVYGGHALPARGPVSPANKFWFDAHSADSSIRSELRVATAASRWFST